MRSAWLLGVLVTLPLSACFDLTRLDRVAPGSITGRTVDEEGAAVTARVELDSQVRVVRSGADGAFVLANLSPGAHALRFTADDDGDGRAERGAVRVARIAGGRGEVTGSVLFGDIVLAGTARLTGTVSFDGAPAFDAFVVVERTLADIDGGADDGRHLAIDGRTAVDGGGAFSLGGLVPGKARVWAFTRDGKASAPQAITLGEENAVALELLASVEERTVQLLVVDAPGTLTLDVFAAGNLDGVAVTSLQVPAVGERAFPLPVGVYDLRASTGVGAGVVSAVLIGQPVPPRAPGSADNVDVTVRLGVLSLRRGNDPCAATAADRDDDGVAGLPPPLGTNDALWIACATDCVSTFGQSAVCNVEGVDYDCDDDGDGQPDVTEPFACVDLCAGGDRDGDLVCDAADALRYCAANDSSCTDDSFSAPPSIYLANDPCATVVIDDDSAAAAFAGCTEIGTLEIDGAAVTSLSLPNLLRVTRSLTVTDTALPALVLPVLEQVAALKITANGALQTISLGALKEAGTVVISTNPELTNVAFGFTGHVGDLTFANNSDGDDVSVVDVDLGAVRSLGTLIFASNGQSKDDIADVWNITGTAALTSFAAISATAGSAPVADAIVVFGRFGSVEECGDIIFIGHPVDTAGMGDLGPATQCGVIQVDDASRDVDFSFAPFLKVERATKLLIGADRLSSLAGLENLRSLVELSITSTEITDYTPLTGLRELGSFTFRNNTFNTAFPDLPDVLALDTLFIGQNNRFVSESPFPRLKSLGTLVVDNNLVEALRFPQLETSVLSVEVSDAALPLLDFQDQGVESLKLVRLTVPSFPPALAPPAAFRGAAASFVVDTVNGITFINLQGYAGHVLTEVALDNNGALTNVLLPTRLDVRDNLEIRDNAAYCAEGEDNGIVLTAWQSVVTPPPSSFVVVGNCTLD